MLVAVSNAAGGKPTESVDLIALIGLGVDRHLVALRHHHEELKHP